MDAHVNNGGTYAVQSVNNEGTYPIHGAPLHRRAPIWESRALTRCIHHGSALGAGPAPNHAGTLHCYPTASHPVSQARDMMYWCLNSSGTAQCWASQDGHGEGWGEGVWNMQTRFLLLISHSLVLSWVFGSGIRKYERQWLEITVFYAQTGWNSQVYLTALLTCFIHPGPQKFCDSSRACMWQMVTYFALPYADHHGYCIGILKFSRAFQIQ